LIAIAATIANTTQAALPIADSSQSASFASCTSVPPSFFFDLASAFAWGLLGLVVPALLVVLTIFYGLILPGLEDYLDRRLHQQLVQGKLPPLSASRLRERWYRNPRPWKVQP
jgi:hypothetical protein